VNRREDILLEGRPENDEMVHTRGSERKASLKEGDGDWKVTYININGIV